MRSNAGTRKTVSSLGASVRFIRAIWNSYSKSLTARRPRTITVAPTERAKFTSKPSNDRTSMALSRTVFSISATRSSSVNSGCFETLTATATTSLSTNANERWMRSS